jgi:hypothetical protein
MILLRWRSRHCREPFNSSATYEGTNEGFGQWYPKAETPPHLFPVRN